MVIYGCPDFEVILHKGSSDFLLITFSSLGMFDANGSMANGSLFWGRSLAEKFDYAAVGFVAKKRNWFCSPDMPQACNAVASIAQTYGAVVVYGSSMGGFAALRWASALRATSVISFAPQFSIEPRVVRHFDRRYQYAYTPEIHDGMGILADHVGCPSFMFLDPTCAEDRGHARLIELSGCKTTRIDLPHCGHECIRVLSNAATADSLINGAAQRDEPEVKRLMKAARRSSSIRPFELAKKLMDSKPSIAAKILAKFGARFEISQQKTLADGLLGKTWTQAESKSPQHSTTSLSTKAPQIGNGPTFLQGHRLAMGEIIPRLVHMHVPKTAGTALRSAFVKHFSGSCRIFPEWDEKKYKDVNVDDYDFFSGHFGFDTAKRLNGDIVTVLRHPVDRFLSVYYFWKQLYTTGVEKSSNTELAHRFDLADFVTLNDQLGLLEEFQNRCTFQIAYGSSLDHRRRLRLQGLSENQIFDMAVANLRSCKVVGIQENMPSFSTKIHQTYGIDLHIQPINVTKERVEVDAIPISVRRSIQKWVYMDLELYQEGLKLAL